MVYDVTPFFNEVDVLRLRLEYLYNHVDKFVIVESNRTYSGRYKGFVLEERYDEVKDWSDKIIYVKYKPDINENDLNIEVNEYDENNIHWRLESAQRDLALEYVNEPEAIMMVCDLDEIWNPKILSSAYVCKLGMSFHYYYANYMCNQLWRHPFMIKRRLVRHSLNDYRNNLNLPVLSNSGWHLSYLGGVNRIKNKIISFAHQEYNKEYYIDENRIKDCIENGKDLFDRKDHKWEKISMDYFPKDFLSVLNKHPNFLYNG